MRCFCSRREFLVRGLYGIGVGAGLPLVLNRTSAALAAQGAVTGASGRNWEGYGAQVDLPPDFSATDRALLTDPQTSGGLLVSCAPSAVAEVLAVFARHGFGAATQIGEIVPGGRGRLTLR